MATELQQDSFDGPNKLPNLKQTTNVTGEMNHREVGAQSAYEGSPDQLSKKK